MVTYDLDQAEQMDWILHLHDDGTLATSESTQSFFASTNIESLKNNLIADEKNEPSAIVEIDPQAKGIISEEEQENNQITADYGVILDYFGFADKKFGGRLSFLTIIGLHILINIATSSLSFYLAYALSSLSDGKQKDLSEHSGLGGSLVLIVIICLVTTIIGKMTSSLIFMSINRSLHSKIVSSVI